MDLLMEQCAPSISAFVVKQCRKFNLLYNERTTLLSSADQFQLVQYCLACYKQSKDGSFEASPLEVISMSEEIQNFHLGQLEHLFDTCSGPSSEMESGSTAENEPNPNSGLENEELMSVLEMFTAEKEKDNLCTLLDCYKKFLEQICVDDASEMNDLHCFLKSCTVTLEAPCNADPLHDLQMRIFERLRQLNPAISPHTESSGGDSKDNSNIIEENDKDQPSETCGLAEPNISHPKTPNGKVPEYKTPNGKILEHKTPNRKVQEHKTPNGKVLEHKTPNKLSQLSGITNDTPRTPATPDQRREIQKVFVYDVLHCYLRLLVNPRSQLALARVFNIPERCLDHVAFTHIKHESHSSGLSMFQSLSSFVMRVRLGGKGYAPAAGSPLLPYIKGLSELLDFIQKLQTVIEEVSDPRSACRRVVNILKRSLVQCKSGKFPARLVEPCAAEVQTSLAAIFDETEAKENSPQKTPNSGGTVLGRQCLRVLQMYLDKTAVDVCSAEASTDLHTKLLADISFSSQTPTRIPCLLTQFRSPCMLEPNEEMECNDTTEQSSKPTKQSSNFVSSALYLDEKDLSDIGLTQNTLSTVVVLPSSTLVDTRETSSTDSNMRDNLKKTTTTTNSSALTNVTAKVNNKSRKEKTTAGDDGKLGKRKAAQQKISKEQENVDLVLTSETGEEKCGLNDKKRKTKQSEDLESTPKSTKKGLGKTEPAKTKRAGKSCRKLVLPQVQGQSKITGFFRL